MATPPVSRMLVLTNLPKGSKDKNEELLSALFRMFPGFNEVKLAADSSLGVAGYAKPKQAEKAMKELQGVEWAPGCKLNLSYAPKEDDEEEENDDDVDEPSVTQAVVATQVQPQRPKRARSSSGSSMDRSSRSRSRSRKDSGQRQAPAMVPAAPPPPPLNDASPPPPPGPPPPAPPLPAAPFFGQLQTPAPEAVPVFAPLGALPVQPFAPPAPSPPEPDILAASDACAFWGGSGACTGVPPVQAMPPHPPASLHLPPASQPALVPAPVCAPAAAVDQSSEAHPGSGLAPSATPVQTLEAPVAQLPEPTSRMLVISGLPDDANQDMLNVLFASLPGFTDVRLAANNSIGVAGFEEASEACAAMRDLQDFEMAPGVHLKLSFAPAD